MLTPTGSVRNGWKADASRALFGRASEQVQRQSVEAVGGEQQQAA